MVLAAQSPINAYVGAGNANTFPFTFPVFSQNHLLVTCVSPSPNYISTPLILGTDYTVTGLNPSGDPAGTGSIVLVNAGQAWLAAGNLQTGWGLVIQLNVPLAQTTSLRNQGDFYRSGLENALDNLAMQIQQMQLAMGAQLILPTGILPSAFSPVLPVGLSGGPGLVIGINPSGTGLVLIAAPGTITIPVPVAQGGTGRITLLPRTRQVFLSGSGTYTKPAGVLYINVRLAGGGGGGAGSGTGSVTTAGDGGLTSFGTSLLVASGGTGANANGNGGFGGSASLGSGPIGSAVSGGTAAGAQHSGPGGGMAGAGSGCGGGPFGAAGTAAAPNSGAGGGGGGGSGYVGGGGGEGGWVDAVITSPAATYPYVLGGGGGGGAAGTSGFPGGSGGSGTIIVDEFYF